MWGSHLYHKCLGPTQKLKQALQGRGLEVMYSQQVLQVSLMIRKIGEIPGGGRKENLGFLKVIE